MKYLRENLFLNQTSIEEAISKEPKTIKPLKTHNQFFPAIQLKKKKKNQITKGTMTNIDEEHLVGRV